jgi:hypothetical protein
MMATAHAHFEEMVDEVLDAGRGADLKNVRDKLRRGEFEQPFADAIVQQFTERGHQIDLGAAWVFAQVWAKIMLGDIAVITVDVGSGPHGDRFRKENQEVLDLGMSDAFTLCTSQVPDHAQTATFFAHVDQEQNCSDRGDGSIGWSTPIVMDRGGTQWTCGPRRWVPLEIGYTRVETTWIHLRRFGALARWPYGSSKIAILMDCSHLVAHVDPSMTRIESHG